MFTYLGKRKATRKIEISSNSIIKPIDHHTANKEKRGEKARNVASVATASVAAVAISTSTRKEEYCGGEMVHKHIQTLA